MKKLLFLLIPLLVLCCSFSISPLSLEEKVGQLLIVSFEGERVNDEAIHLVRQLKVGGIVYYNWANGLTSPSQVKQLSEDLQHLSHEIPLLIAIDQEGGSVSRLKDGFTQMPANAELGKKEDLFFTEKIAYQMAQEMQAVGINMNLAPVVDIHTHPDNSLTSSRSYGNSPEKVVRLAEKSLLGYQRGGVLTVLKHFPGHGDTFTDSHQALPVILKDIEELEACELFPFYRLAFQTDAIMTGHLLVPALDQRHCATLSSKILGYLRNTIKFEGVIISDSMTMRGVLENSDSIEEAMIQALQAGCDMLLIGEKHLYKTSKERESLKSSEIEKIHLSIIEAIKNGRLEEEKINCSVERILKMKEKMGPSSKTAPFG